MPPYSEATDYSDCFLFLFEKKSRLPFLPTTICYTKHSIQIASPEIANLRTLYPSPTNSGFSRIHIDILTF